MKGIYCLVIKINKNINQKIGALGELSFLKGSYVYVGSAQKGIKKRVERHLRKEKKLFWHIDYLLDNKNVSISKVLMKEGNKKEECRTAKIMSQSAKEIDGFGCSDCNCKSHLFKMQSKSLYIS